MANSHSVAILGATGAVGSEAAKALAASGKLERLTLLGRRPLEGITGNFVKQLKVDIMDPHSYDGLLAGHDTAICTLGVGQPSKVSKETFVRIDKIAVEDFAQACREAGVLHFQILSSVDSNAHSKSFYLRSKGELDKP